MRMTICLLLIIAFVAGAVTEAVLQVQEHIDSGIQVMTKLLSQSEQGTAQVIGGLAGIVSFGEKLLRSLRIH